MAFVCTLTERADLRGMLQASVGAGLIVMVSAPLAGILDFNPVFGDTNLDEVHIEPSEDDIQRAEVHPQTIDPGAEDGSDV